MLVSVIIPAYNEEKRIAKTLDAVTTYMAKTFERYEILIVNDGSTDNTEDVCMPFLDDKTKLLSYGENRGKGGAVKFGIEKSAGDFLVFTDADLPYPVKNIKKAADLLSDNECDFVLGERKQAAGEKKYPLMRRIMSRIFSFFVKIITGLNVPDTQCGFKAFSKNCAKTVFSKTTICGWGFDVEAIFIAVKHGFRYTRLPVELYHDIGGSKINAFKDSAKMLSELKKIKENDKKGLYN